jgi:hypothetical protein
MISIRKLAVAGALVGATASGAIVGMTMAGTAGAQTSTTTPAAATPTAPATGSGSGSSSGSTTAPSGAPSGAPTGGRGSGAPSGPHQANGKTETPLTGDDLAKVTAAVNAKEPGATIVRAETDADGDTYEAHITTADGATKTVKFDASFNVTKVVDGMG